MNIPPNMMKQKSRCGAAFLSVFAVISLSAMVGGFSLPAQAQQTGAAQTLAAQNDDAGESWVMRCNEPQDGKSGAAKPDQNKSCEIFQRLVVSDSGQRIAEFAIGFPSDQDMARGVAVLPLGIMLDQPLTMQIDDGKPFTFKVRYCVQDGCYAFLNLTPEIIDMLKRGGKVVFSFTTLAGQPISIDMSLKGITKALKGLGH